ncbi:methyltransferase regulatory domain-containing protein [Massilia sp. IC2-477]|uniref:class I SAM-dependent methyltransferase n=1 Tax=Massilia sp. IC2-477 TaxID=2887198 RepID=UPI001D104047|nr:class I SAM-dependent methyltransferase [Massilia sp. IC2-477]MCC2958627.1 methyltransferase regulatory domain-containing protein [Massilia sp. IC2-477]
MSEWTGGYVADIAYTHGYYPELNPQRLKLAFLNAGYAFPETGTACELGFGQGISTNVHAAASVTRWYGTDFNPTQASFAQELASVSGAGAQLFDEAFDEFCNRPDLPDFDFIGLHGIWSWVSDANRKIITEFIRRKLKVGGVVYISYNTQPGWGAMVPMRDLLTEHAAVMNAPGGGIVPRIDAALAFADKLKDSGALYFSANPQIVERLDKLKQHNRNYLAHEYFNRDWAPMPFSRMNSWLEDAKLSYACSAHHIDHINVINLTPEQQQLLSEVPDRNFRETVRDFIVNRQFRKDYWVRGLRPLTMVERVEILRRQRFVLAVPVDKVAMTVAGPRGEATLQEDLYRPILERMADHRPHSLAELQEAFAGTAIDFNVLQQAMMILVGKMAVYPAQEEKIIKAALPATTRLNRMLCEQARYSDEVSVLASPVTGGGINLGRVDKLFMLARANGAKTPEETGRYVINILKLSGQRIVQKDGKVPETPEAEMDEALRVGMNFERILVPILKTLRIEC